MASVVNRQTNVVPLRKVHAGNYIIGSSDIDGIHGKVAELARLRCRCEWIARLILVVCVHRLGGFSDATQVVKSVGVLYCSKDR